MDDNWPYIVKISNKIIKNFFIFMFIIINIIMGVLKRLKDDKTESGARCEAIS